METENNIKNQNKFWFPGKLNKIDNHFVNLIKRKNI